jgi:hypothetical protein
MKYLRLIRYISLLTAASVYSAGAATGDPQVRRARQKFESRNTYAQGILGGAAIGAGIGALLGALSAAARNGDIGKGAGAGALIGAGAGGIAGKQYADEKVRQRRAYLAREQALDNAIKNARSTRLAAREFNHVLAARLRNAQQQSAPGTLADARSVQSALNREIVRQRQVLAKRDLTQEDRGKLGEEIEGLIREQQQLQSNVNRLSAARRVLR